MHQFFEMVKNYSSVVIQLHDNPDADAIATGFGLQYGLRLVGVESEIVYYGRKFTKPNIKEMVNTLKIPIENKKGDFIVRDDQLLVIVDAQRDNSNVFPYHAKDIACIDHHIAESNYRYVYSDIKYEIGSCATIISDYLFSLTDTIPKDVATALYFGIYMDTNSFVVQFTNLDKDIRDTLLEFCDMKQVTKMIRTSLTFEDIKTCSIAMQSVERFENIIYTHIGDSDDNLLGHIADLLSEIAGIDIVVIYSEREDGYKLSIRSYHDYISAENIIHYLTFRVGAGGGHTNKAGGYIASKDFNKIYPNNLFNNFVKLKVLEFCQSLKLLETGKDNPIEIFGEKAFRNAIKRRYPVRYIDLSDHFPCNLEIGVKTLEGLIRIPSDHIAIIGPEGEVYGMSRESFEDNYNTDTDELHAICDSSITDYGVKFMHSTGDFIVDLSNILDLPIAEVVDEKLVRIMSLTDNVKVRTPKGDLFVRGNGYLVYQDINNYTVLNDEIFNITHRIVPSSEILTIGK